MLQITAAALAKMGAHRQTAHGRWAKHLPELGQDVAGTTLYFDNAHQLAGKDKRHHDHQAVIKVSQSAATRYNLFYFKGMFRLHRKLI